MRPIDEKIVSMKLDNRDFARKATETTGIIGGLVKALNLIPGVNLGKTTNDLGRLQDQANRMNFSTMASGIQNISSKFTTLGIVGVTALANIANRAVNVGLSLTKNLAIDPVLDGFNEYELKIGSIQTILSNTKWDNTSLKDVNSALDELNTYADKTIYNFSQMTSNIGRFTAAGVSLGNSTIAIKGLGNLAAVSGSTSDQLNTAMYQMSQALASGKLTLMDWNSLVNAGMGGKITQDALLKTAKDMGVVVDTTDGFRNSLQSGWLSSKILLETLKKFGKDESMIEAATKVRTFTQLMSTLKEAVGSGWATSFENIFGDFGEATNLWSGLADKISASISNSANARNKFLKDSADMGAMKNIFDGIVNASKPLIQVFSAMKEGFEKVFPPITVTRFVKLTETFKSFTAGLLMGNSTVSKLTTVFQGVFAVFSTVIEIVKRLTKAFISLIPAGTGKGILDLLVKLAQMSINFNKSVKEGNGLTAAIDGIAKGLRNLGGYISGSIGSIEEMATAIRKTLGGAITWTMNLLKPLGAFIKETFKGFGMQDVLGASTLTGGFLIFQKFASLLKNVTGLFSTTRTGLKTLFSGLGNALQNFVAQVKYDNLLKIAVALGILAVSLKLLEGMKTEDVVKGVSALTASMGTMLGAMMLIQKLSITGGIRASLSLIALSTAVLIMASALKKISDLNMPEIIRGITGLVGVTAALSLAVIAMSKWGVKLKVGSLQLIALATAILILSDSIKTLSAIDTGQLWKSIGALTAIFAQLAIFLKVVDRVKFGVSSAVGMVAISAAILIMASGISKIAEIDTASLVKGLVTITLILGQMVLFSMFAKGPMLMLAGAGLLMISAALTALLIPIKTLGDMSWDDLLRGLSGIAIAMAAIAAASYLMSGTITAGLGMMAMAAGLTVLLIPIKAFSKMTWGEMLKGFAGLAIAMTAVAVASLLLSPTIVPMLGFGAALLLMGTAMLAVGVGIGLFGTGLAALAGLTATSVAAIVSALKMLIEGLGSLIMYVVKFVVDLSTAMLDGIDSIAPKLINTIADLIMKLIAALVDRLPEFQKLGSQFIIGLINGIDEYYPKIVDAALKMIVDVINGVADAIETNGPLIVNAYMRIFGEIIVLVLKSGVDMINALLGWIPGVKKATSKIGETAEKYVRDNFGAKELGESKGDDFVQGLLTKESATRTAGSQLASAGADGLGTVQTKGFGINFGQGFILGMGSKTGDVSKAAWYMGDAAKNGIQNALDIHSPSRVTNELGQNTGQGFADGITSTEPKVKMAAKSVADVAKDQLQSSKDWIDDRKYYNQLSLQDELAAWERIQARYKEGTDERKEADREVYRVHQELVKADFDNSKKWVDDRKYYNELSLTEELSAWERVQARYKEGTAEREEADREVYRVKNELNTQLIQINDDYASKVQDVNKKLLDDELQLKEDYTSKIDDVNKKQLDDELQLKEDYTSKIDDVNKKLIDDELKLKDDYENSVKETNDRLISDENKLTDEYNKAIEDRTKSLVDFVGLFDEVPKQSEISGQQLIDNLKGQVDSLSDWSDNVKKLSKRGIDQGLLDELTAMGPKASGDIAALNTLTDDQLTEYVGLWKTKNQQAGTEAVSELETLRLNTSSQIEQLKTDTNNQLAALNSDWQTKSVELRVQTANQLAALNSEWQAKVLDLRAQTAIQLTQLNNEWQAKIVDLRAQSATQLDQYKTEWIKKIQELSNGTKDQFVSLSTDMKTIGSDTIKGMMSGMSSMQGPLQAQAKTMADSIAATIKSALKIKSPSRITMALGAFTGQGLAEGIGGQVKNVADKAKELAITAKESLNKFLDGFNLQEDDNEIHIKAVVDWDGFNPNDLTSKTLRIVPDTSLTTSGASAVKTVSRQNDNNTSSDQSNGARTDGKSVVVNQNLTFNSKQLTPSEVARKNIQASKQLAMQWG